MVNTWMENDVIRLLKLADVLLVEGCCLILGVNCVEWKVIGFGGFYLHCMVK